MDPNVFSMLFSYKLLFLSVFAIPYYRFTYIAVCSVTKPYCFMCFTYPHSRLMHIYHHNRTHRHTRYADEEEHFARVPYSPFFKFTCTHFPSLQLALPKLAFFYVGDFCVVVVVVVLLLLLLLLQLLQFVFFLLFIHFASFHFYFFLLYFSLISVRLVDVYCSVGFF